jgi:hypothetical protein
MSVVKIKANALKAMNRPIRNAIVPWTDFRLFAHLMVPIFFPTVEARASPIPNASVPHKPTIGDISGIKLR